MKKISHTIANVNVHCNIDLINIASYRYARPDSAELTNEFLKKRDITTSAPRPAY